MKDIGLRIPHQVTTFFGDNPISSNGKDEVAFICPQCAMRHGSPDTKGKLYVNIKSFAFHCFRCGYSGYINKNSKIDENKVYDEDKESTVDMLSSEIQDILLPSQKFSLKIPLKSAIDNPRALSYLLNRGFTEKQIVYYDMRSGGLDLEFGRIVIPNQVEKLVYTDFYSARTYIDQVPKYHNPRVKKSSLVFNLHRIKEGEPIIIVEGALTAVAAGYNAVATLGKTITKEQASLIAQKHPSIIYLNYDYGAEEFSHEACKLLKSIMPDIKIMEVLMKDDRDAADLTHEEYAKCLEQAIEYNPLLQDIENLLKPQDNN